MKIPFSYIWRSLWARRLTTALTIGGVALVVFVFAGVLMNMTLANSLQEMNEFADEITYRISGDVQLMGSAGLHVSTVQTGTDAMAPVPLTLGAWWGDKFQRLFENNVTTPNLKQVECTVDLLPDRRIEQFLLDLHVRGEVTRELFEERLRLTAAALQFLQDRFDLLVLGLQEGGGAVANSGAIASAALA